MQRHIKIFGILLWIIIISFILWGVGSFENSSKGIVAQVGDEKIPIEEYWRAYDRLYEFYKLIYKDNLNAETLKNLDLKGKALDGLIEQRLLVIAAKNSGVSVTNSELTNAIETDPAFQRGGVFNKNVYLRTLQLNHLTPDIYEKTKKRELIVQKFRRMITESVDVTDDEVKAALAAEKKSTTQNQDNIRMSLKAQKEEKAVSSYIEAIKKQIPIKINKELL